MKILLLGKNGQLARALEQPLAALGELVVPDRQDPDLCGDLADTAGLARTVRSIEPDVIVNAAAYTAVDLAEQEPARARAINALAPGVLAEEAARQGALLVHYSTDYVFDGSGTRPWRESDATSPLNVYGTTKRDGERAIECSDARYLILRTSWIHSEYGNNFLRTMLKLGAERETLRVVDDQIGAPTDASMLAAFTAELIGKVRVQPQLSGIYHCVPAGETSWHAYAAFVFDETRARGASLRLRELQAVASTEYVAAARRPLNSRLDTTKLSETLGCVMPPWQSGVVRVLNQLLRRPS